MPENTGLPGPREIFEHMRRQWLGEDDDTDLLTLAEDAVVELPFAPPGRPRRYEGRDDFLAFAGPQRAALPVRFDEVRNVVIHDTTDPEVIVVEYELAGTITETGDRASAPFIGVLQVKDGRTTLWREYQNVLAMAHALGRLPALLGAFGETHADPRRPAETAETAGT